MTEELYKSTYRIILKQSERPRERLALLGLQVLSNAELIGVLLRVGVEGENAVQVGQRLLNKYGGSRGLHRAEPAELTGGMPLSSLSSTTIPAAIPRPAQRISPSPARWWRPAN